jgi:methyl-accepting chemotaxis protein
VTTGEQATIALVVVVVIKEIYQLVTAGQKFDDRIQSKIDAAITADKKAKEREAELKEQLTERQFSHMADDIRRISDSIAEIMRMLRESVATKQDILQMDARMDAVEESNRDHYDNFKKVREEIASLRVSCAKHHRTGDTSAFPRQQ